MKEPKTPQKMDKPADQGVEKRIVDYLPESVRQTPWFQKIQIGLDWLSSVNGKAVGFGVLVVLLGAINYLNGLNNPKHPFWDESYYLTSTQRYVEGTASFASHPPLGFMFMAIGEKVLGDNDPKDMHALALVKKTAKDSVPKSHKIGGIRAPSALFAVVSCGLFYALLLVLIGDAFVAFVFGLMFVFENAFIVHFRAAHLDSYQLTFVLGAMLVWAYLFVKRAKRPFLSYAAFGALIGLSFMVKVNSSVVMALGAITLLRDLYEQKDAFTKGFEAIGRMLMPIFAKGATMMASFIAISLLVFSLNTILTPKAPDPATEAGARDLKAMSAPYRDFVEGKTGLSPKVLMASVTDYVHYMKGDFTGVVKREPNEQLVSSWPWLTKTISYRWDSGNDITSYTTFIGNQFNWRLGLLALLAGSVLIVCRRLKASWLMGVSNAPFDRLEAIMAMWVIFMLVHAYLGTQRVMYVYHYFIGLCLSFVIAALVFQICVEAFGWFKAQSANILTAICVLTALTFTVYAPFSYHQPLSRKACEARNWPVKIITCMPVKKAD